MNKDSIKFTDILDFFAKKEKEIDPKKVETQLKVKFKILENYNMVLPKNFIDKLLVGTMIRYVRDKPYKLSSSCRIVRVVKYGNQIKHLVVSSLIYKHSFWNIHPEQYFTFAYDKNSSKIKKILSKVSFKKTNKLNLKVLTDHDPSIANLIIKNPNKKILSDVDTLLDKMNSKKPTKILSENEIFSLVGINPSEINRKSGFFES